MPYDVLIERRADGEKRLCHIDFADWDHDEESDDRAGGREPEIDDPDCTCGTGRYRVIEARLPDGRVIPIDES